MEFQWLLVRSFSRKIILTAFMKWFIWLLMKVTSWCPEMNFGLEPGNVSAGFMGFRADVWERKGPRSRSRLHVVLSDNGRRRCCWENRFRFIMGDNNLLRFGLKPLMQRKPNTFFFCGFLNRQFTWLDRRLKHDGNLRTAERSSWASDRKTLQHVSIKTRQKRFFSR